MIANNVCVKRPNPEHSIYVMVSHKASKRNPYRDKLLSNSFKRMKTDGLNNLFQSEVSVTSVQSYALFTHIKISVGKLLYNYD